MAWEVSRAGMMPSVSLSNWNASSASVSVTETYRARSLTFSHECSGPTPG